MFNISTISIPPHIRNIILISGVCLVSGVIIGKYSTPAKVTTVTKTEYVDRVKIEYVEKKTDTTTKTEGNNKSTSEVKNNIVTETKIKKKDGTVIETTITDTSTHLTDILSSITGSMIKAEEVKDSTSLSEHVKLTEDIKIVDNTKKRSVFDFGLGLSYKGKVTNIIEGNSIITYKDGGISAEMRAWDFGLQAQAFGDGSVVGTIKYWF